MDEDLEDYWADLKPPQTVKIVGTRGSDIDGLMDLVAEKTIFDLTQNIRTKYQDRETTPEILAEIVSHGVRVFMKSWREALRHQNLTGLIELVLEGQGLNAEEIQSFVRALPMSLLKRIAQSAVGTGSGTHALMSLEVIRREHGVQYRVGSTGSRVWAEFEHPPSGHTVQFFLDEAFSIPND